MKCSWCERDFTPKVKRQKYCSKRCNYSSQNAKRAEQRQKIVEKTKVFRQAVQTSGLSREASRLLIECRTCKGPIPPERDNGRGPIPVYCSDACSPWQKKGLFTRTVRPPNPNAVRLLPIARANDARWKAENPGVRMSQSVFLARMRERRG